MDKDANETIKRMGGVAEGDKGICGKMIGKLWQPLRIDNVNDPKRLDLIDLHLIDFII